MNYKKIKIEQGEVTKIEKKVDISKTVPDLSCLDSPNWLNDEIINEYLQLLQKENGNVFVFTTFFFVAFQQKGFDGVRNYYRKHNILSYKLILIPIHHSNHWFLISYDGKSLVSLDPYNYQGSDGLKKEQLLQENKRYHKKILVDLRDHYFKLLFTMYGKKWNDLRIKVRVPPTIPAQNNSYDCGVFLLTFSKYLVLEKEFDFTSKDMRNIRNEIKRELFTSKICHDFGQMPEKRSIKRKSLDNVCPSASMKQTKIGESLECRQRRFWNHDNEVLLLIILFFSFLTNHYS